MAHETEKDFNAMLRDPRGMPRIQTVTDERTRQRYGGSTMLLAPPADYDAVMRLVPPGRLVTVGMIRDCLARRAGADFTDPMTAGIFVSIAAWASFQRHGVDETPWWRTLKAHGELNEKYPGGADAQRIRLEAEGHSIVRRGRTNVRLYVRDYESALFDLGQEPAGE